MTFLVLATGVARADEPPAHAAAHASVPAPAPLLPRPVTKVEPDEPAHDAKPTASAHAATTLHAAAHAATAHAATAHAAPEVGPGTPPERDVPEPGPSPNLPIAFAMVTLAAMIGGRVASG